MLLETAQLLCMASYINNNNTRTGEPYKPTKTHLKHPCTLWAADKLENWNWLVEHGRGLAEEFKFRRKKSHKSAEVIEWCAENGFKPQKSDGDFPTSFKQCMPDEYKNEDTVTAYRTYYLFDKKDFATWNWGRPAPEWWTKEQKSGLHNVIDILE